MSAPGQEPNKSGEDAGVSTGRSGLDTSAPQRDIIPIWLIVGIFVVVLAVTWFLLAENWFTQMARYRSIRAQQNGDYVTAIDQLKWLMETGKEEGNDLAANSPTYLSEIGYSYMKLGQYENALKYYQLAQENRTNMGTDDQGTPRPAADFNNRIGYVQLQLGDVAAAKQSLQAALQHDKLDPLANFTLGQIAMQEGDYIQAADYFKVVANNPKFEEDVKKYYGEIEEKLFAGI